MKRAGLCALVLTLFAAASALTNDASAKDVRYTLAAFAEGAAGTSLPKGWHFNQLYGGDALLFGLSSSYDSLFPQFDADGKEAYDPEAAGISLGFTAYGAADNLILFIPFNWRPAGFSANKWLRGFSINAYVPLLYKRGSGPGADGKTTSASAFGMGDFAFGASWRLSFGAFGIEPSFTVKTPAGATEKIDGGIKIALGSGSWDYVINVNAGYAFKYFRLVGSAGVRFNGTASFDAYFKELAAQKALIKLDYGDQIYGVLGGETDALAKDLWIGSKAAVSWNGDTTANGKGTSYLLAATLAFPYAYYKVADWFRVEGRLNLPIYDLAKSGLTRKDNFADKISGSIGMELIF